MRPKLSKQSYIAMAAIATCFILVGVIEARGANISESRKHEIYADCKVATSTRTSVSRKTNIKAANRCYRNAIASLRQRDIDQSYIDANNAWSAYLRDKTRAKNRSK